MLGSKDANLFRREAIAVIARDIHDFHPKYRTRRGHLENSENWIISEDRQENKRNATELVGICII